MHREAKKNALLAEAENEIMDVGDRNTQDGFLYLYKIQIH